MKISKMITDKYKLRIPPTVYYDLLADVVEIEEQEPCNDCVSREAVFDWLCEGCERYHWNGDNVCLTKCEDYRTIAKLPPVQPKQKTGHWVENRINNPNSIFYGCVKDRQCSECGERFGYTTKFCPNCGATMNKENKDESNN